MTNQDLEKQWKKTRYYLNLARKLLPSPEEKNKKEFVALLNNYKEYLTNNELELALDMLEGISNIVECSAGFWRNCLKAAESMNLTERAARYDVKVPNGDEE